jgi:hypothetical protein
MKVCNFCHLKKLRKDADRVSAEVVVRVSPRLQEHWSGSVDVYVVPAGEKLDTTVDERGNPGRQWKAWFPDVSDRCVC